MFYIAGISISFFLSLVLLTKENKNLADKFLAAWLIVIGVHLWFFYANISGFIFDIPWVLGVHLPIPLLHGPFLYLYAAALTGNLTRLNAKSLSHFIPAAVDYLYLVHFFLLSPEEKINVYTHHGRGEEPYLLVNFSCIIISGISYVIATSILLRRHKKKILQEFSDTEKINLNWIQYLIYGISLIWLLVIFGNDRLVFGSSVAFVIFIGYFGIRQVKIFAHAVESSENESDDSGGTDEGATEDNISLPGQTVEEPSMDDVKSARQKYSKSGLNEDITRIIHNKLKELMEKEKVYKQNELTLQDLAKKLAVHPNHVSQVINKIEGKNFYDYINTLRVEEVKARLSEPGIQKYTLLSIAFESGFNSKSTFNKYFRKVTGVPPSDYLQQIK